MRFPGFLFFCITLLFCEDGGELVLRLLQLGVPFARKVFAGPVDVEVQHPHAGGWAFGRDFFRCEGFGDGCGALIEEAFVGMGGVSVYLGRPLPCRLFRRFFRCHGRLRCKSLSDW